MEKYNFIYVVDGFWHSPSLTEQTIKEAQEAASYVSLYLQANVMVCFPDPRYPELAGPYMCHYSKGLKIVEHNEQADKK